MGARASGRMLGIDFGARRIGLAVSDGRIAVPLTIIEHTSRNADIDRIAAAAREHSVTAVVVGLPLLASGDEGEQARLTRAFARELEERLAVPVEFEDETLSSADVERASPRARRRGRDRARTDDLAAALILQRHIDAAEGPAR